MCGKCVEAVKEFFPDCPEDEMGDFLFAATCFPFGSAEQVRQMLVEAKETGCKTWQEAIAKADQDTLDQMARYAVRGDEAD